ncbi:hypothetical protein PFMALIP_00601 [Plasmodium falciparum MaliPS096_E11]|uniref:Regulator of initiation factor 2 n=1 Tax=Plasmodium falciparum MaliPS096_E11 TaxID=1036727 RepID=A0A024WXT1_PLAFA|nr:hypothetical protein PFMALIP_00601 [Plasmodium falciparum MaliPS096_E11]
MSSSCHERDKNDEKNKEMNENMIYTFYDVKILLNTFIYLFILRYFKNVEIFFNSYRVKDNVVNFIRHKIDDLFKKQVFDRNHVEKENMKDLYTCDDDMIKINVDKFVFSEDDILYKNQSRNRRNVCNILNDNNLISEQILDMNKMFEYVKRIHLNIFLLVHTNGKNVDYPYNLLNVKIDLYLDKELARIYSSDGRKEINVRDYLKIIYKKYFCYPEMLLYKENKTINEITQGENYCNNNINIYNCHFNDDLNYKELVEIINDLIFFLFEDNFYNASISKENKICYKRLYEQFNKIMIKSKIIKLNEEMLSYLLIDSIFIPDYVHKNTFKQIEKKDHYLILSKYVNINICFLFDVYVYDNNIIGISQKYLNYYFPFLNDPDVIIDTINLIKNMFEKNLKNKFFCNNYIFQVYIHTFKKTKKKKLLLINSKSWLYKNKHPYFTNRFLKYYIYTDYAGVRIPDEKYMEKGIYKYKYDYIDQTDSHKMLNKETTKDTSWLNKQNENDEFDFYLYDDILYYCIVKNDSIYKKNTNIYPKDLNYIKEGEIDIDNLIDTMKRENNIQ